MTIDITSVTEAFITLAVAVIATFVIPFVRSKTTAAQRNLIYELVKIAVSAAEQIYKGSGRGEEKKQYVLDYLKSKGYTVDEKSIEVMLESAVHDLNQKVAE